MGWVSVNYAAAGVNVTVIALNNAAPSSWTEPDVLFPPSNAIYIFGIVFEPVDLELNVHALAVALAISTVALAAACA